MGRIILVSTSHVARESAASVKVVVAKEQPDCVAVELDQIRYAALVHGQHANTRQLLRAFGPGVGGLFAVLRFAQELIGKRLGVIPGIDMLAGVEAARDARVPIAFLDQDIRLTALKLRQLPKKEMLRLFGYLLFGVPAALLPRKNLEKVPEAHTVAEAMEFLRVRLPTLHHILVAERDAVMARRLAKLAEEYDTIVAVVGAGHAAGMKKLLADRIPVEAFQ